jgi:transcriptional regulator with XRE-family HTH domain
MARRIAFERERRGWSTESLAKRMTDAGCPINQSAIWKIENGQPRRKISYDEALAFAQLFELSITELAVAPEIAANDTVRTLLEEHQRLQLEVFERSMRSAEIVREVRRLLADFPDAERVIAELFPDAETAEDLTDFYAGRGKYAEPRYEAYGDERGVG